jgi:hypothetical protein
MTIEHNAKFLLGVVDALSINVVGTPVKKNNKSESIWTGHKILGHRSWKVVSEYLRETNPWQKIRHEITRTLVKCEECKKCNIPTLRVNQRLTPIIMYASTNYCVCMHGVWWHTIK